MTDQTLYQDLSPTAVHDLMGKGGVTLVDVRETGEFAAERIPGAVLHPLSSFDPKALPQGGTLILQCGSGKRSATAMAKCRAAGVACLGHVAGGIMAWKAQGLPTTR